MLLHEITPHLNKVGILYLKNHKRKTGLIFSDADNQKSSREKISFLRISKAVKLLDASESAVEINTKEIAEEIDVRDLMRVRSSGDEFHVKNLKNIRSSEL